jgi:hypothetical protein
MLVRFWSFNQRGKSLVRNLKIWHYLLFDFVILVTRAQNNLATLL